MSAEMKSRVEITMDAKMISPVEISLKTNKIQAVIPRDDERSADKLRGN